MRETGPGGGPVSIAKRQPKDLKPAVNLPIGPAHNPLIRLAFPGKPPMLGPVIQPAKRPPDKKSKQGRDLEGVRP